MGFFKSIKKAVRKVYDATSKSKYAYFHPVTLPNKLTRDAWRKYKKYVGQPNSASSLNMSYRASGVSPYGATGSIVGRF